MDLHWGKMNGKEMQMPKTLSIGERSTLEDVADPSRCLIHDGPTIESLVARDLIIWDGAANCFRLTDGGRAALRSQAPAAE
ncbi:hypothetical protein SAMN02745157_1619 [Kaistia soli DSM 19436]|uniref:Uncharacterized protein n=1 Tax=Kaistia soli DSM 19436 TaxID=1122133 RepID=A0A1M4YTZ6_9HYPH|nr:hypothetical protein [Kaistia soli]SHF09304.1 hypothetical protein SAMN02745157_1619 [Kaistia soli DSM 19436]